MRKEKSSVITTIIKNINKQELSIRHKPIIYGYEPVEIPSPLRASFPLEKLDDFRSGDKVKMRLSSDNFVIDIFT